MVLQDLWSTQSTLFCHNFFVFAKLSMHIFSLMAKKKKEFLHLRNRTFLLLLE